MVILLFLGMVATEVVYVKVAKTDHQCIKYNSNMIIIIKAVDTYRIVFNRPAPLPDVERLHPAELVGSFSR